jgi:hypothetical protein
MTVMNNASSRLSPSRHLAARAAGIALWTLALQAGAQQCLNDTPPTSDGSPPTCTSYPSCPTGEGISGTVFEGGEVVHFDKQSVGPCDTANAYSPTRCEDPRATCDVASHTCKVDFLGLMYKPGPTPPASGWPAVMLIPGSTACSTDYTKCVYQPERFCGIKSRLLSHGYVVFEPLPRGYGVKPTLNSTGIYVSDLSAKQVARNEACAMNYPDYPGAACSDFDLKDEGHQDMVAAGQFLKNRSFVDPAKVAVIGHSLGAIRTMALNEIFFGQRAVVAIAPGSESWCLNNDVSNEALHVQLEDEAGNGRVPLYVLQPQNDVNISPTTELSYRAGRTKRQFQAAVFPKVRDTSGVPFTFGDWAHSCFVTDDDDLDRWFPTALDFIQRYGVK